MARMRRRVPWWVLALMFIVLPVIEIYLLIQAGQAIGAGWTLLVIVGTGVLGSLLVKREGARAWRSLQEALRQHRMPASELADGALILVGGTLLLTPGFVTDAAGLFCTLPVTRPLARRALTRVVARRLVAGAAGTTYHGRGATSPPTRTRPGTDESVVRGEVVD